MGCHLAHRARTAPFGARVWMIRTAPAKPTYVGLVGGHGGLNARRDRLDRQRHRRHLSGLLREDRGAGPSNGSVPGHNDAPARGRGIVVSTLAHVTSGQDRITGPARSIG